MELDNSFDIPVPIDQTWKTLLDAELVARCIPGATLESVQPDGQMTGRVTIKLGPMVIAYSGHASFVEVDEEARRMVLHASGTDVRGAGSVRAQVELRLTDAGPSTRCDVHTSLDITGKAAQFGGGLIRDVSAKLIGQFSERLTAEVAGGATADAAAGPLDSPLDGMALARSIVLERARLLATLGVVALVAGVLGRRWLTRRRRASAGAGTGTESR